MTELTYNRPYQYVEDLRLIGCYRSSEHTVFIGQGFADNAVAFIEHNSTLIKLEQQGRVQHGDYDQLVTQRFDVDMPFRIYVVNPDDENGKASNAIEYTPSKDIPVIDVLVDGKSVVKDQKAYIDISKKLDSIMKPNMIYGTDSDGKETQYPRQQIEGVQHFFLNGEEVPLDMGNIRITDIARESKSVQRVSEPLQLYGTNEQGAQATYPKSFFATSESVINAANDIQNLKDNKQDKDGTAHDGYIAIMKSGQSIGSNTSLDSVLKKIDDTAQELSDLTENVKKTSVKDWKSKDKDSRIENNPVGDSSIVISDKSVDDEKPLRDTNSAVVYGLNPQSVGQYGTMMGSSNQVNQYGTTIGSYSSAKGDSSTAIGTQSQSDGDHATALGVFANAQKTNSIAIGKGAQASADNATALGPDSTADVANTVSIGFETSDSQLKPQYRRLMAVDDPVLDHDAANKKYVDEHSSGVTKSLNSYHKVLDAYSPLRDGFLYFGEDNVDKWVSVFDNDFSTLFSPKISVLSSKDFLTNGKEGNLPLSGFSDTNFMDIYFPIDQNAGKYPKKRETIFSGLFPTNNSQFKFEFFVGSKTPLPDNLKLGVGSKGYIENNGDKNIDSPIDSNVVLRIDGSEFSETLKKYSCTIKTRITSNDFKSQANVMRIYFDIDTSLLSVSKDIHIFIGGMSIRDTSELVVEDAIYLPFPYTKTGACAVKIGGFVYMYLDSNTTDIASQTIVNSLCKEKIPEGFRPGKGYSAELNWTTFTGESMVFQIGSDGMIYATGQFKGNSRARGSVVYPTQDALNIRNS